MNWRAGYSRQRKAGRGVADAPVVDKLSRIGNGDRVWRTRGHRLRLVERRQLLAAIHRLTEEQIVDVLADDLRKFRLAGDLALASRDGFGKLILAIQLFERTRDFHVDVLQCAELHWRGIGSKISGDWIAPQCAGSEMKHEISLWLSAIGFGHSARKLLLLPNENRCWPNADSRMPTA